MTGAKIYNEMNWQGFPKQTGPITISYGNGSSVAAAILYVFVGGLTLLLLFGNGFKAPGVFIAAANLIILMLIIFLRARAKKRSVKSFDEAGVTALNGEQYLWADFRGKVLRIGRNRYGKDYIWRTELMFTENRQLWILPQRVKNFNEINAFLKTLPVAALKDRSLS